MKKWRSLPIRAEELRNSSASVTGAALHLLAFSSLRATHFVLLQLVTGVQQFGQTFCKLARRWPRAIGQTLAKDDALHVWHLLQCEACLGFEQCQQSSPPEKCINFGWIEEEMLGFILGGFGLEYGLGLGKKQLHGNECDRQMGSQHSGNELTW